MASCLTVITPSDGLCWARVEGGLAAFDLASQTALTQGGVVGGRADQILQPL
jgi:hypothetical protein